MKPEEIRNLLGGYASGTLSDAEKKLLFEAALEDQVLFDAMADEQALKDLLDDPESRGYLRAVLDEAAADPPLVEIAAAPAPASAPMMMRSRAPRRPAMWWGLVAAAGFAAVSVVGILQLNKPGPAVDMARTVPSPVVADKPVQGEEKPPAPSVAAVNKRKQEPRVQQRRANEVSQPAGPAPMEAAENKKQDAAVGAPPVDKDVQQRVQSQASPPPPATPVPSQQQHKSADSTSQAVSLPDTLPLPQQALYESARQLYFSPGAAAPETAKESDRRDESLARQRVGGAAAGVVARLKAAAPQQPPKGGFAMRYRFLRRTGTELVPVSPGTKFRVGEEVVLAIEKNAGGFAVINRLGEGGVSSPVPMAIQTSDVARSAPLTITGPMEFVIILTRTNAAPTGIPLQPPAQKAEVADGMVYIAEPATASSQPLVVRVPVVVER